MTTVIAGEYHIAIVQPRVDRCPQAYVRHRTGQRPERLRRGYSA
jgi:hypothetical protein